VPLTATLPDGRRRDGVGTLDLVDPMLPLGPVHVVAAASVCQRAEATLAVQPGPAVQRLVLASARPFPVSWTVVDDLNQPLAGLVRVTPVDTTEAACAPGDVPFTAGAGATTIGPGHYTLRVTADGYKFKDVELHATGAPIAPLSIQLEPTVLRVVSNQIVADPIYFDPKSDRIAAGSDAAVDGVAQTILSADIRRVTIHGHTDDAGADDVNMALSWKRAEAVRDRLISLGVPADRLTAIGHGETQPVMAGTSAAARAKNRRVEFVLEAK
jgi:outer membrane protein OmpA-like peptidoglycan-associated protein